MRNRGGTLIRVTIRVIFFLLLQWVAAGAQAAEKFQAGVCVHIGQNKNAVTTVNATLAAANLSFRDEIYWHRLEVEKGKLQMPANLKDIDTLVDATIKNGQRPLLILDYGNTFYDGGGLIYSDAGIAAFTQYVRFVVNHFRGRVDQFEVWNEWNIGLGSPTTPRPRGEPKAYVALLKASYQAIKAIDPSAHVIAGAVSGIDKAWIDAFGRYGGFQYLDGFSVHPYVFWHVRSAPSTPSFKSVIESLNRSLRSLIATNVYADTLLSAAPQGTPETAINDLDALKQRIDVMAPGRNLPIYITEIGWPTNTGRWGVSESAVAAYVQRFMLLARSRPWLAGVWWYDLIDDGDNAAEKEHRFGLLTHTGAHKPAFDALLKIKDILSAPNPTQIDIGADNVITATTTLANGTESKVVWQASDDFSRTVAWSDAAALSKKGFSLPAAQPNTVSATPIILYR